MQRQPTPFRYSRNGIESLPRPISVFQNGVTERHIVRTVARRRAVVDVTDYGVRELRRRGIGVEDVIGQRTREMGEFGGDLFHPAGDASRSANIEELTRRVIVRERGVESCQVFGEDVEVKSEM